MQKDPLAHRASPWNLAPILLIMTFFFSAYAVFFFISLQQNIVGGAGYGGELSLANYVRYFTSAAEMRVLVDTLWISTQITILTLLLGYPLAYVIVRAESRLLRGFLLTSLIMSFLSGSVTRAYAWLVILGNSGLLNTVLAKLSFIERPIQLIYNEIGVSIALLHFVMPFFVLTMMGPIKNVPRAIEESAINLGASRMQTFMQVTLPLSVPGIIAASSLTFAIVLSSFVFPLILGGGRVRMVANAIYEHIFTSFDFPFAAATATVFLCVALFFVWAFSALQKFAMRSSEGSV